MNGKTTPILVVLLIIASFAIGSMWTKIQYLQSGVGTATPTTATQQPTAAQQPSQPSAPSVSLDKIKALFADGYIHFGDANKKVLFTEISDPSCPFCHFAGGGNPELAKSSGRFQYVTDGGSYNPPVTAMKQLVKEGKASFAWVYSNGHGSGEMGAQAFYCANEKGKFWEVHDLVMSNKGYDLLNSTVKNDKTKSGELAAFLAPAIDSAFMKQCLDSGKYANNISRDQQAAQALGFQGTPDFFVNTTNFNGAVDYKQAMEPVVKNLL